MAVYIISRILITLGANANSPRVLSATSVEGRIVLALLAAVAITWIHALIIAIRAKDYSELSAVALFPINTPVYLWRKWKESNHRVQATLASLGG